MSKNYFRTQLRKLGKGSKEKKSRGKSSSPTSPDSAIPPSVSPTQIQVRRQSHGTDSPVHASPLVISSQMPKPESSYSLASNTSQTSLGAVAAVPRVNISEEPLDRREIISITVDVQNFVAAISRLKKSMEEADNDSEDKVDDSNQAEEESDSSGAQSAITTNLKDLIQVVHSCLDQYQTMQSTEIKNAATELMTTFQNCDHMSASRCPSCNSAVDMLIDAFTNSVQVFLNGDQQEPPPPPQKRLGGAGPSSSNLLKGFSKSHDNLVPRYSSYLDLTQQFSEPIVDEIDQALAGIENNVDVAARYVKLRTKYHREVASYLSKRGQIELRYHQEMLKLARKTHTAVADLKHQEECLPLVDLFLDSVDQDMRFASNCNTTYSIQVGTRVVEPLEQKIVENERVKKELTQTWHKELKKLTDARTSMKNACAKYRFLGQDLARVKTLLSSEPYGKQAEKRKKEVVELETKWNEAEAAYKNAVQVCNECQYQVHKSAQQSILCAYRRLVLDFDMVLRSKLETYFQLQHNFFLPIPDVMDHYLVAVQDYDIGSDFMHYIERHPKLKDEPEDYQFEEFSPEEEEMDSQSGAGSEMLRIRASSSSDTFLSTEDLVRRVPSPQPLQAWGQEAKAGVSPRMRKKNHDRARPSSMAFLLEPNPDTKTPVGGRRNSDQQTAYMGDVLTSPSHAPEEPLMSKNALTHTLKRLRAPSRCRECDNYVYFNGYECEICGLACHKKCLKPLAIRCGNKRLDRKLTTFGVDFLKHLKMSKRNIPIIVTKCIKEIEERGLETHGLYRISTTKTKLEHLCQLFESGADRVDLSDRPPHLIASCLKLYFRQLPEPILTFELYSDMLSFARDASYILPCNLATVSEEKEASAMALLTRLRELLSHLDYKRYITLARLLYHLNRVSSPNHVRYNAMPASNLGIVYGPTLLRRRESVTPLSLLADMTAQAKAIEILISHVHDVFTTKEEEILREEEIDYEEGECIQERLVDGIFDPAESQTKSPETDMDDTYPVGSRTPFGTPPQRRRENISELGDVLEALQSAGLFPRNSQPSNQLPMSDRMNHPTTMSLPSVLPGSTASMDDTSLTLRLLHQSTPMVANLNKTLTPVDERIEENTRRMSDNEDEEEDHITTSPSRKFDLSQMSRSTSGLSNPSSTGILGDMDSEAGSIQEFDVESLSLFSGGDPPRPILASLSSMENVEDRQETKSPEYYQEADENFRTTIMDILEKEKEQDSSQESSENHYEPMSSKNVQALLDRAGSPTASYTLYSSSEGTPVPSARSGCTQISTDSKRRTGVTKPISTKQMELSQLSQEGPIKSDQSPHFSSLSSWSQVTISNRSSPSAPQWDDDFPGKAAPQGSVYSTRSLDSMLASSDDSTRSICKDGEHTPVQSQVHAGAQNGKYSPLPQQHTADEHRLASMTDLLRTKQSHLWDSPRHSDSGIEESDTTTSLQSSNGTASALDTEYQPSDTTKSRAFTILFSSQGESSTKPSPQVTSPTTTSKSAMETMIGLEEESEELVTSFDCESDDQSCDSEHTTPIPIAVQTIEPGSNGGNSKDEMAHAVSVENPGANTRTHVLTSRERKYSAPTQPSALSLGRKVSPWHDKNRKIRINPLRVLKVTPSAPDIPTPTEEYCNMEVGRVRMASPEEVAKEKPSDMLRRSKSCGVLERPVAISTSASLHTISEASETASSFCVTENSVGSQVETELSTDTTVRKKGRREPQFV